MHTQTFNIKVESPKSVYGTKNNYLHFLGIVSKFNTNFANNYFIHNIINLVIDWFC